VADYSDRFAYDHWSRTPYTGVHTKRHMAQ